MSGHRVNCLEKGLETASGYISMVVQRAGQRPMIAVIVIMQNICPTFDACATCLAT